LSLQKIYRSIDCVHRDEHEYEMELRRQKDELAELNAERQRLLAMQQHLLKLQESVAAATSAATTQVSILPRSDRLSGNLTSVGKLKLKRID